MDKTVYIREVAGAVGLTPQAIRFYERLGLIEKAQRTRAGYRTYPPEALRRVRFIKEAQRLGFSLEEIREILRLKYSGQSPCDCVRELLSQKLRELKKQIQEMDQMRRQIAACLRTSQGRSRLPHAASVICPIVQSQYPRQRARIEP